MRIQSRKLDSGLWGNYDFLMQHGEDDESRLGGWSHISDCQ